MRKNWSKQEDDILLEIVKKKDQNWKIVSKEMINFGFKRSGKSCKERYSNQLNPDISKDDWSQEEIEKLFALQNKFGNRWREIARGLPQRTDCLIKNFFYSFVRKVLRRLLKRVYGTKNGSALTKQLKPSVISNIFCVTSSEQFESNIEPEFALRFKSLIMKYKNFDNQQQLDGGDENLIKILFRELVELNQTYNEDKEKRKNKEKIEFKYQLNQDKFLLKQIKHKKPIFTSGIYAIHKHYEKKKNNALIKQNFSNAAEAAISFSSVSCLQSQSQLTSVSQYLMKPEQYYFYPMASFYSMTLNSFFQNPLEIVNKFNPINTKNSTMELEVKEENQVKEEQE